MRTVFFLSACLFIICINIKITGQGEDFTLSIVFWNVENLFDPFDDSLTMDDEFTPEGMKHWTWTKFERKLNHLYKVITMADEWNPPDIIGLCEVENRFVLRQMVENTPLSKYDYRIIHYDSPDPRGIDVSMLYLPDSFEPSFSSSIRVPATKYADDSTRDILYVKGLIKEMDTVHMFINHWPSRYQGEMESTYKRNIVAELLKQRVDSLFRLDLRNRIIIFGDFNDEPEDISIAEVLAVKSVNGGIENDKLYNMAVTGNSLLPGTQKYQGKWFFFDQFIVSGNILLSYDSCSMNVLDFDFLLEEDESFTGLKPFRTYNGYQYRGGFSDHLPIMLRMVVRSQSTTEIKEDHRDD